MICNVFRPKRCVNGKSVTSRLYRGRYCVNGQSKSKSVALHTTDKQIAKKRLQEIVLEVQQEQSGMIAPKIQRQAAQTSLDVHAKDFLSELGTRKRSQKYIYNLGRRLLKVFSGCLWKRSSDVSPDTFMHWRGRQKVAPKTLNEYLDACNAFFKWMEESDRIAANPLRKVKKVETRGLEVRKRRALNAEEAGNLLAVAGLRKAAYLTALFTGLRRNELKQLEWSDVHLDEPEPFLTVRSSITKNKRETTIRLHKQLADELWAIKPTRNLSGAKLFAGNRFPGMWVFKSDLKRAGIPYADAQNRKADFHALRYTFATNLTKAGVSPREAMELMRHSDLRLTMKTYTDAGQLCTGEALAKLPSFTVTPTGQAIVSRPPLKTDAQIDAHTPVSHSHKLAQHGTQTPSDFDSEVSQNEDARHDLALAGMNGHGGLIGSSGRIRTYDQAINSRPLYH